MIVEIALSALIGAVVTGTAAYVTLGRRMVTREDLAQLTIAPKDAAEVCETHCPYLDDKTAVRQSLEDLKGSVNALERRQQEQGERLAEVQSDVRTLVRRSGAA